MPKAQTNSPSNKKPRVHKRVHAHVRHHYHRVMPEKKRHRIMIWVAFLSVSSIIAAQLLYPVNRSLPFASLFGESVGMKTDIELAKKISDAFLASKVKLQVNEQTHVTYPLGETGAEPDIAAMSTRLVDYPFWQRFVPLSIIFSMPRVDLTTVSIAPSVGTPFSEAAAKKLTTKPTDARLSIENDQLVAEHEQSGTVVSSDDVRRALERAQYRFGRVTTITVPSSKVKPSATASDLSEVRIQAEAALTRQLQIRVGEEIVVPSREERAGWLLISSDKAGVVKLAMDQKRVKAYISTLNKRFGVPAGQTNISLQNGQQISQQTGSTGKALDEAQLLAASESWLLRGEGQGVVVARFVDVPPSVIYDNKYTSTEEGLRAYVADAAKEHQANIVIEQLDGHRWTASDSADLSIPSASTYKLFVAKILFDKMDKGQTSWNDAILNTTVDNCFDQMTIASTNACSQEWLARWGRQYTNEYVWRLGFSRGTSFTEPDAVHTTAADLARFMKGLENGSLIGGAHRDRLYRSLSTHPYRYGIPTGSKGRVYDKVGFLWDYVHDAAIVYHPQGKYVMVVMTKGRSYGTIASITRDVERIMYP